ncbi:MAG: hypothetical protein AB1762_06540 [Gemmatimonadota bacterium]
MKSRTWGTAQAAVAGALMSILLSACAEDPNVGPAAHGAEHSTDITLAQRDGIEDLLPVVKRLTQPYQDLNTAIAAGYNASLTPCMENPPLGGMGYHYGNPALIDGVVQALKPEILVYEPLQNGQLQLVAVEYVVPYTAWTKPNPPAIAGVAFHKNDAFQLWVMHAWVWKRNPSGTLSDWNPTVSCRYASSVK